jgi:hypothetical protein
MDEIKMWRCAIPSIKGQGWGIFLLDSTGMFAAVTDYGNYAFKWTHHGCDDFREFVIDLKNSPDYVLGKVSHGKEYQGQKTNENIKNEILRARREGYLSEDQAKEEWELVGDELEYHEGFLDWYNQTSLCDAQEMSRYDYPPDEKAFAKILLPRLAQILEKELENEKAAA